MVVPFVPFCFIIFHLRSIAPVGIEIETLKINVLYEERCLLVSRSPCVSADPVLTPNALNIANKMKISTSLNSGSVTFNSVMDLLFLLSTGRA